MYLMWYKVYLSIIYVNNAEKNNSDIETVWKGKSQKNVYLFGGCHQRLTFSGGEFMYWKFWFWNSSTSFRMFWVVVEWDRVYFDIDAFIQTIRHMTFWIITSSMHCRVTENLWDLMRQNRKKRKKKIQTVVVFHGRKIANKRGICQLSNLNRDIGCIK